MSKPIDWNKPIEYLTQYNGKWNTAELISTNGPSHKPYVIKSENDVICLDKNGTLGSTRITVLVRNIAVKKTAWVNIYPNEHVTFHASKALADERANKYVERIGCVPIEYEE